MDSGIKPNLIHLSSVYVIKTETPPSSARISLHDMEIANLRTESDGDSELSSPGGGKWRLSPKVDGEIRPFSLLVEDMNGAEVLKVKYSLFLHRGSMYMIGNVPESKRHRELLLGEKYISRLVNFPISSTDNIDHEIRSQLRRFRGAEVGVISGIGLTGHKVSLTSELDDIGLHLAAACYLLYTTPHGARLNE